MATHKAIGVSYIAFILGMDQISGLGQNTDGYSVVGQSQLLNIISDLTIG